MRADNTLARFGRGSNGLGELNIPGGIMTTSLRWGLCVLATLALQVGCCSIHVDYQGTLGHGKPNLCAQNCQESVCEGDDTCGINGIAHLGRSVRALHGRAACGLGCGAGCGEVYWDEHINEPPFRDPCGCDNEWVGGYGHARPWYSRLRDLWGYSYPETLYSNCDDCGHRSIGGTCSHCGHESHATQSMVPAISGETWEEPKASSGTTTPTSSLKPVPTPSESRGTPTPAKPRQIPSLLPGDSESPIEPDRVKDAASGKTARAEISISQEPSSVRTASTKKISGNPVSGRRRLSTQSR